MEKLKRFQATLVSHTHWDRAWYVPYQEFRIRLVRLVDRLLNLLRANPNFGAFMLDGQMSVLEDYLEVRPQRAAELQAYCQAGRIQVGPWYILADEFLSSPEALIRNLMLGRRMGVSYGGVMKVGYVPDGFGHIAQLPQILNGFGIDSAFFWRGMGIEGDRLGTEFEWVALDGSSVTTTLMPYGYHNVSNLGYGIHWGDTSQMVFNPDIAQEQIAQALERLKPWAHTPSLLLMNGIDHAEPEPRLPEVLARANLELPDTELVQGTLHDHLLRVRAAGMDLPHFTGEFRWGRYSEVLQGVYSTRIYLKQANQRVETLLEHYVEPLTACAWMGGGGISEGTDDLIWLAWRTLIQSHAHDDLYGSGVDQTHRETLARIEQAGQVGQSLLTAAIRALARQADCSAQEGTPLLIFNPLGWARSEVVVGEVALDFDDPAADDFTIVDGEGQPVPFQLLADLGEHVWMEVFKANRKRKLRLAINIDMPACGYRIVFLQKAVRPGKIQLKISSASFTAANEFHHLTVSPDGSLEIENRQSGVSYKGLHIFEDIEDAGDEYSSAPCLHSQTLSTANCPAKIELLHSGPIQTTFRIEQTLFLPVSLTPDRQARSTETVATSIVSEVSLFAGQQGVYVITEIDNRSKDHKLSVVFPTLMHPEVAMVDESFAVLPRPVELPPASGWVEDPSSLMHQRSFTDLSENERGLAVLNRCLPSVEVRRIDTGTQIVLPLLRSVGWLSRADLSTRRVIAGPLVETPEAQCLGHHRFEYAILPHSGDWHEVYPIAYTYVVPLLLARADTNEGLDLREMNMPADDPTKVTNIPWKREGPLPQTLSFFTLEPHQLILSALRRTADGLGLVIRGYNLDSSPVVARLTCCMPISQAWRINLNEEHLSPLEVQDTHNLELPIRGGEIFTVELRF